MPDWTYHPFFKPLLFSLPAERARRVTLGLLALQASTAPGRRLFQLFGHGDPPERVAVTAFGLRFPCPIGIAPGIDIEASAASVLQYLGAGFLVVGPAGRERVERRLSTDPVRIEQHHAIASSPHAGGPSASELAARIRSSPGLGVPVGVALRGAHLCDAIRDAEGAASFFSLPASCAEDAALLRSLRETTRTPLLLRLPATLEGRRLDEVTEAAVEAGIDGCVAVAGWPFPMLPDGEVSGLFLLRRALASIEQIARRHGDRFPILGAGGIMSPEGALACLDAGARLVELYEGLVYAGPGLPGRILHAIERRIDRPAGEEKRVERGAPAPEQAAPLETRMEAQAASPREGVEAHAPPEGSAARVTKGWQLLAFTGLVLVGAGSAALGLAATVQMLPYDVAFLGMTVQDLCDRSACRIVHFMAHDRVSFGGSIISIGVLYVWLAAVPLREGRAWAWWTLALSGAIGFGSFLTYLGYGYLDVWHGIATLLLLPFYLLGILWARASLEGARGIGTLLRPGAAAWRWSPAGMGRAFLTFSAVGMILGGATIMGVGVTRVFVPQDLEYMQTTVAELDALNPRLIPLIAHDRAGFGGGLCSGGLTVLFSLWCGARPGARGLWVALLSSGVIGFACAIGVHPIVGYTSFTHLAPAYAGALAFVVGIVMLYRPLWYGEPGGERFPEL